MARCGDCFRKRAAQFGFLEGKTEPKTAGGRDETFQVAAEGEGLPVADLHRFEHTVANDEPVVIGGD